MQKTIVCAAVWLALFCGGCKKTTLTQNLSTPAFVQYLIPKGQHYAGSNELKAIETAALKMVVRFDSSAVYHTANPENQYDINKLFGFSDNGDAHHRFSARFGWRWSDGALRLFAYTYNEGLRDEREIGTVGIGADVSCAIMVEGDRYLFLLNGKTLAMPRRSTTKLAKGYRLYPYFGGNEPAPHDVRIWLREEE